MNNKIKLLIAVVVGSFFIFIIYSGNNVLAVAEPPICATSTGWSYLRINEFNSYDSDDWVEIYNLGNECVVLDGLWLGDSLLTSPMKKISDNIRIESNAWQVIDVGARLNRGGDSIILTTSSVEFDRIDYGSGASFSAPTSSQTLSRNPDGTGEWQLTVSSTPGLANVIFLPTILTPEPPTTTLADLIPPTADTSAVWAQIKINEFVSDPESGNEWVELYNSSTSSLDLSGGWICDSRGATSTYMCKSATGTILVGGWLTINLGSSYLNNDGDSVIFKNSSGELVDQIDYSAGLLPKENQALARKIDGVDTDNLSDWAITTQLTSGAANIIVAPAVAHQSSGGSGSPAIQIPQTSVAESVSRVSYDVVINELYPNPPGSDAAGEFIEIKNISNSTIDLSGWKIGDMAQTFNLSGVILPGQIVSWPRTLTKISLNNTAKETVKLYNEKSEIMDVVEYDKAKESESYCRGADAKWAWSSKPTPGKENEVIIQSDGELVLKINAPSGGEIGEMLVFDAEDSADRRGGELNFIWHFSDGIVLAGGEVERSFSTSGVFAVLLSASSTSGSRGSKTAEIIIGSGLSVYNTGIIISEILPNPAGDDSGEFIEIYNSGESTIDLSGWYLRRQSGQGYVFPAGTLIQPDGYLVFNRTVTRFSLNNQGDKIELLTRDSQTADLIKFGAGPSGKSYSLFDGGWQWTAFITAGQINQPEEELSAGIKIAEKENGMEIFAALTEARLLESGQKVRTRGIVSVLPGIFGSQFFYLSDENGGIQIYNYKKDFPPLKIGDFVEVSGEISVSQNVKRIKIKNNQAIDILELEKFLEPQIVALSDIQEEKLGSLIKISGEITEIKTNGMYVDDGQDEIFVYFKKGAQINKKLFQEGELVSIFGILEEKSGEWQLWPRSAVDIQSAGLSEDLINKEALAAAGSPKKKAEDYLTATIGGLTALLLGFVGRARGALLKTVAKKTGALVLGAVFKRKV